MGTTPPRALRDFFANCEFPDNQKARIAETAIAKDSPCGRALLTYAARTRPYTEGFKRYEKIPGARVGTKFYRQRAVDRILGWLADNNRHGWEIYRDAALLYIEKEITPLYKLLAEAPAPPGAFTVGDALRTMCGHATEFDVSKAQILQFYELWGAERVDGFESTVDDWMKPDPAAQHKRQIAALTEKVDHLAKSVGDTLAEIIALKQSVMAVPHQTEENHEAQRVLGDAQRTLAERVAALTVRADRSDEKLSNLEGASKDIGDVVTTLQCDSVPASAMSAEAERLETSASNAINAGMAATRSALEKLFRGELATVKGALEKQLSELSEKHSDAPGGSGRTGGPSRYSSPLLRVPPCPEPLATVSDEMVFAQSFAHRLVTEHELDIEFGLALAYHRGFLANRVVVAAWAYVKAWLDCLEWHAFSVQLAANPTWSHEEHWADAAEHLFRPGISPRFAVIHNYDVALVDYYLTPSLSVWYRVPQPVEPFAKLFLVPSAADGDLTPLLAEHAFVCRGTRAKLSRDLTLRDAVGQSPAAADQPISGVDPAAMRSWIRSSEQLPAALHGEINRIETTLNCTFGSSLKSNVRNTTASAGKYFTDLSAIGLAMDCHVAPWIHSKYDGEKDNDLHAALMPLRTVPR